MFVFGYISKQLLGFVVFLLIYPYAGIAQEKAQKPMTEKEVINIAIKGLKKYGEDYYQKSQIITLIAF